jgi:hypothetical protein
MVDIVTLSMIIIKVVIIAFMALEAGNIVVMYFKPEFKFANGIGVFNAWEKSKEEPSMYNFTNYLVKWVAGSKIIFVLLLTVILVVGWENDLLLIVTIGALIPATMTFYFKLFPLIRKMDKNDQITPKGYSIGLALMILGFIIAFTTAFVFGLIMYLM